MLQAFATTCSAYNDEQGDNPHCHLRYIESAADASPSTGHGSWQTSQRGHEALHLAYLLWL